MKRAVFVFLLVATPVAAAAGPILINPFPGITQVDNHEPIGQSFTAEDPFVTAALYFGPINPSWPNTDEVLYELYSGAGVAGAPLASSTFSLATGFVGFYDVDFSLVQLTVGNTYSLTASTVGSSPYWGLVQGDVVYAGGEGILSGSSVPHLEFAFRVTPILESVPEPSTLLLFGSGFAAVAARRRFKQRAERSN